MIVSDLLNDTTPLLRYDIGDLATLGTPMPFAPVVLRLDRGTPRQEQQLDLRCLGPAHRAFRASRLPQGNTWRGTVPPDLRRARSSRPSVPAGAQCGGADRGGTRWTARNRRRADPDRRPKGACDRAGEFRKAAADHRSQRHRRCAGGNASSTTCTSPNFRACPLRRFSETPSPPIVGRLRAGPWSKKPGNSGAPGSAARRALRRGRPRRSACARRNLQRRPRAARQRRRSPP